VASPRPDLPARIDRVLAPLTWVAAAFAVAALLVGPELIGAKQDAAPAAAGPAATATAEQAPAAAGAPDGEAVFADAGCGNCHTLAAAGAAGGSGPNLDDAKPDAATVSAVVTNGRGAMPSFSGELSGDEIQALADYVAESAGR
jgi:mono/diheme cytochrome c family protein